jgi:hypothetical protein
MEGCLKMYMDCTGVGVFMPSAASSAATLGEREKARCSGAS